MFDEKKVMLKKKNSWLRIALVNLAIVALLGVLLRAKILFSIPGIDFKHLLHAHSHFAFGGWVTLCLLTLMTYEILPTQYNSKPVYRWILTGIFLNATGMLFSFPIYGYAFASILFSTLFMFTTYVFSWVFIRDLLKSEASQPVNILCISALVFLVLSSAGPFTLAYLLMSHSTNTLLYQDSIYTYLHLNYNGFFTLSVFALFFAHFSQLISEHTKKNVLLFSIILSISVLPTLFLSYLWHYHSPVIRVVAMAGCVCLIVSLFYFVKIMLSAGSFLKGVSPFVKRTGFLSMVAFALKTVAQIGIFFPFIGNAVFVNRPVIIGYLHLVMLGFITLYLLAHLVHTKFISIERRSLKYGIIIFSCAVIFNEVVLMTQGLFAILLFSSILFPWLLLMAAIGLFTGALLIMFSAHPVNKTISPFS